jgi:hypothetical protein
LVTETPGTLTQTEALAESSGSVSAEIHLEPSGATAVPEASVAPAAAVSGSAPQAAPDFTLSLYVSVNAEPGAICAAPPKAQHTEDAVGVVGLEVEVPPVQLATVEPDTYVRSTPSIVSVTTTLVAVVSPTFSTRTVYVVSSPTAAVAGELDARSFVTTSAGPFLKPKSSVKSFPGVRTDRLVLPFVEIRPASGPPET